MSKRIIVKLKKAGNRTGPFTISDNYGNVLGTDLTKQDLIDGVTYSVDDVVSVIIVESTGKCKVRLELPISQLTVEEIAAIKYVPTNTASLWKHLVNILVYNRFYDVVEPYIVEYPFAFQSNDEILQNVKDYTRAIQYLPSVTGAYNDNAAIEINSYFNKAILYNGQQCSGLLNLVPKPMRNLQQYLTYPIYNDDSKTITYAKSDGFYQYNTFWGLVKNKNVPLFLTSCESLSIDKVLNQDNMDYGKRSYKKEPIRAKFLKVRHILDDKSDLHLISGFVVANAEISYK
jgi:hypothetical protein